MQPTPNEQQTPVEVYRSSKILSYQRCPSRYYREYVAGNAGKAPVDRSAMAFGTIYHAAIAAGYKALQLYQKGNPLQLLRVSDGSLSVYQKEAEKLFLSVALSALRQETATASRNGKIKDPVSVVQKIEPLIKQYAKNNFDPFAEVIAVEERGVFYQRYGEEDHEYISWQGTPDLILADTMRTEFTIIDHKTGRRREESELVQAALYTMIVYVDFLHLSNLENPKITMVFDYISEGSRFTYEMTPELYRDVMQTLNAIAQQIEEDRKSENPASRFPAKPSALCGWCEYRYDCTEYQNLKRGVIHGQTLYDMTDPSDLAAEYIKISGVAGAVEQERVIVAEMIKDTLSSGEVEYIDTLGRRLRLIEPSKKTFLVKEALAVICRRLTGIPFGDVAALVFPPIPQSKLAQVFDKNTLPEILGELAPFERNESMGVRIVNTAIPKDERVK